MTLDDDAIRVELRWCAPNVLGAPFQLAIGSASASSPRTASPSAPRNDSAENPMTAANSPGWSGLLELEGAVSILALGENHTRAALSGG